jgi:FKBP-type peptidyl-prolyl cis-trans isomerase FklB
MIKCKDLLAVVMFMVPAMAYSQKNAPVMKNELDSVSYTLGIAIGTSLKTAGISEFNEKLFVQAIHDIIADKETAIKAEQVDPIMRTYIMKLQSKKGAVNIELGRKFLEDNKKKEGVVALPSGLQYKVIKDGIGESPKIDDKVTVNYEGSLIDGKVFDSSIKRGQPVQFELKSVIAGWTEVLQLMKPGAKWTVYIPSELAYGEKPMQGIEPNSVLIFDIELISIDK